MVKNIETILIVLKYKLFINLLLTEGCNVAALFFYERRPVMANQRSTLTLTPEIVLQRLEKVKAKVDKGNISDFSKMCEKTMKNVYIGPILRKHGAVAQKARGAKYHWNGLALTKRFAKQVMEELRANSKKRMNAYHDRKTKVDGNSTGSLLDKLAAELNVDKKPAPQQTADKLIVEMVGDKLINKMERIMKQKSADKTDEKLNQIINLLQAYNENVMHMHSACLKMLNGFEVIAGQMSGA